MAEFYVAIGDTTTFSKTVSESDVYLFAGITGDFSPNHVDQRYMERSTWGRRMVHGALLIGFVSTASTMAIAHTRDNPDETPVAAGFDKTRFLAPVFMGDTVTVRYRFAAIDHERRRTRAEVAIHNQDDQLVAVTEHLLQWVTNESTR